MGLAPVLQPWGLIGAGAATVMEAKLSSARELSRALPVLRPGFGVLPFDGDLRRPTAWSRGRALLARFRTWIDAHTDQVIIWGSLILGFWLIANSINLVLT